MAFYIFHRHRVCLVDHVDLICSWWESFGSSSLVTLPLGFNCAFVPTSACGSDFPCGSDSKASAYNVGDLGSIPWLGISPGGGHGNRLQYSCLENPHGQRSLVGCSTWGRCESDTTERLCFRFSLSCIGEGNGNPLQCSCLENPRAGGSWWAAVYGVSQSWTRLKRLSKIDSFGLFFSLF